MESGEEQPGWESGGPTGDRNLGTVQGGAAKQPKCDHPNDLRGMTRA